MEIAFHFTSNFSSFVELRGNKQYHSPHLLQFGIGIINYKINCQNVGAKTDEVDESVSSFSRHWTESLCQITWSKIIAMRRNSFKLLVYNENLILYVYIGTNALDRKFDFCIWNFVHSLRVSALMLRYFKESHFEFRLHLKRYNEQK